MLRLCMNSAVQVPPRFADEAPDLLNRLTELANNISPLFAVQQVDSPIEMRVSVFGE